MILVSYDMVGETKIFYKVNRACSLSYGLPIESIESNSNDLWNLYKLDKLLILPFC